MEIWTLLIPDGEKQNLIATRYIYIYWQFYCNFTPPSPRPKKDLNVLILTDQNINSLSSSLFFLYICIRSYFRAVRTHPSDFDISNRSRDLPELKTMICKQTLTYCHVPVDQRNEITSRSYSNKTKRSKLNSFKRHRTRKSRWRTFWFCVWFVSHDDCMLMDGVFSLSGV